MQKVITKSKLISPNEPESGAATKNGCYQEHKHYWHLCRCSIVIRFCRLWWYQITTYIQTLACIHSFCAGAGYENVAIALNWWHYQCSVNNFVTYVHTLAPIASYRPVTCPSELENILSWFHKKFVFSNVSQLVLNSTDLWENYILQVYDFATFSFFNHYLSEVKNENLKSIGLLLRDFQFLNIFLNSFSTNFWENYIYEVYHLSLYLSLCIFTLSI